MCHNAQNSLKIQRTNETAHIYGCSASVVRLRGLSSGIRSDRKKESEMRTQVNKSPDRRWRKLRVTLNVLAAFAIAGSVGCTPPAPSATTDNKAAASAPSKQAANPVVAKCVNCGRIESVREVVTKGEGTGLGAVGGAVVGGVLGNQVGGGQGKDLATVVGAVGGAVAGNEIEKRTKTTKSYEITVRLDDGSSRTFQEPNMPSWRPGDQVKINNGSIQLSR